MFETYSQKLSNNPPSIRRPLKAPNRPIAIRNEHIADTKTTLIVTPLGNAPESASAYKIRNEDGVTQFIATERKYSSRSCREFRDASGLPLFELHRKALSRNAWCLTLPGSDRTRIATGTSRASFGANGAAGNFRMTFENKAVVDGKMLTLEGERHGNALASFDIVDGRDRKVAEVRETIVHNKKLALMPMSKHGWRPVLDIIIMPGMDLSLAAVIVVILSD